MSVTVIDSVDEISDDRTGIMFSNSENISFDIETTGLDVDDHITVLGFYPDENDALMMVNKDESSKTADTIASNLEQYTDDDIHLIVANSEKELLDTHFRKFSNRLDNKSEGFQRLCGYNVETWSGGFDVPFIRTRFIKNNIDWYLEEQYVADLLPEVKKYLHTTQTPDIKDLNEEDMKEFAEHLGVEDVSDISKEELFTEISKMTYSEEQVEKFRQDNNFDNITSNGLDESHEMLCGCGTDDVFESSGEAVIRYMNEDFASVLAHCYFDVKRTNCMLDLLLEYTPSSVPSDFKDSNFI